jgi:hypothetical protein
MNNNTEGNPDAANQGVNPPDQGGRAPGAAEDPVRDRREDPLRRDSNFRARQNQPAGRTTINLVAQRLVSNQDATPSWNNERPFINLVPIYPDRLREVFDAILYPIVYGNYRAIGTRTNTAAQDAQILNNIITTVSINAVIAAYAVMYNKATSINTGYVVNFGGVPEVDKFRFPALITHLVNSLGPIQRDRDPYRCLFVPVMSKVDVDNLRANTPGYDPLLEEMFTTGVLKTRNVLVTDVDVNAKDSSHWWTLYVERMHTAYQIANDATRTANEGLAYRGTRGHTTVYCPIHFSDRDSAVLIGGLCLSRTLYDLPGPLRTARVGPYVGPDQDEKNSIPAHLRDAIGINVHPPVVLLKFETHRDQARQDLPVTNAQAHAFGQIQADPTLVQTADNTFLQGRAQAANQHNTWRQFAEDLRNALTTGTGKGQGKRSAQPSEPQPLTLARPEDAAPTAGHLRTRMCTVIYFDHIMYQEFPLARIGSVITESNRLNQPVRIGDEMFGRND